MLFDVLSVFCAGAWASVVILSFTVIEAHMSETGDPSKKKLNAFLKLKENGFDQRFQNLRESRNRLVHAKAGQPALTIDKQYDERPTMENEARNAVSLMFEAFYSKARD